jgi:hypothetical protein
MPYKNTSKVWADPSQAKRIQGKILRTWSKNNAAWEERFPTSFFPFYFQSIKQKRTAVAFFAMPDKHSESFSLWETARPNALDSWILNQTLSTHDPKPSISYAPLYFFL